MKIITPQRGPDLAGVWVLSWYQFNIKYKSGKRVADWTNVDAHFNGNDQVDGVVQYIDRRPLAP